jgi:hypothetical protein
MKKSIATFSLVTILGLMTLTGCATTVFKSNFDPGVVGQPPAHTQAVGTADVAGNVVVAAPPVLPSGKWVAIRRAATPPDQNPSPLAIFQGNLVSAKGAGTYTFTATLFMPPGTNNVATIQFDRFGWPVSDVTGGFLHIDLLPDNSVRIDDKENTKFGQFPRSQVFIVQVTLNIHATSPTAHIVLSGAGATGEATYAIATPVFVSWAQQFGAVKLWMGFPRTGEFDATQIVVTYKAP